MGHSPASVESTRSSKTNMLLVLALCTWGDDKALKSVPSGELGVTKDKTSFAKASTGKINPATEVTTKGEPSRRARAAAPGYFLFLPQDYIICRAMETDCLRFTRRAPTSEGGADKPPNPTEKDMRRISEGGEIKYSEFA